MCGIVGFVDKKKQLTTFAKLDLIKRMTACIDHRGRDDHGVYSQDSVAVGHTRLSILDLTKNGAQPFFNEDKTIVLSYNGEIYNYRELNRSLEKRHKLKTNCDTETVLVSYIDKGVQCLPDFNGMFALSLYDKSEQQIFLAVDRFSIKPLYFINTSSWFAWSSEVKSLLLLPQFKIECNESKLPEYFLFRQVAGEETLFKNVYRVLPAGMVSFSLSSGRISQNSYWDLTKTDLDSIDYEKELFKKINQSVSGHLLSDVPVGIQLSGGIDSSIVTAISSQHITNLNTFSIGLKTDDWNEFRYSRTIAKNFKTIHHELIFTEDEFCRELPKLTYFHDEPISHSHSIPMHFLAREARKHVKVLLSGEGADEVFYGYRRYLRLYGQPLLENDIILSNAWNQSALIKKIVTFKYDEFDVLSYRRGLLKKVGDLSIVDKLSYYDLKTYLPPLLLRQDKMGMAVTLENRVPFLDYTLVEFGFSLPEDLKINGIDNKILLKKVAERFIPRDLIYRKKCGFGQPLAEWFRNNRGLGAFLNMFLEPTKRTFLNYGEIQRLITEHRSHQVDHSEILWTLINLELWFRIFIDGNNPNGILNYIFKYE